MADGPSKRRKTGKSGTINAVRMAARMTRKSDLHWPPNCVPVEIFNAIAELLPRTTVQNLRLNREFEQKVAQHLFSTVVVPFRPEIYGITEEPSKAGSQDGSDTKAQTGSIMLQDKGMRVFQGFGRHIYRFAMSFELDYVALAMPPSKSDQEAITTFWGIYRWPFMKYNRFAQLEGLEQTADETMSMAKALRYIDRASELGLSIDGGLGWLSGPDINLRAPKPSAQMPVFGLTRFLPEETTKPPAARKPVVSPIYVSSSQSPANSSFDEEPVNPESSGALLSSLRQILGEAGYEGEDLVQSVRTLMESEGGSRSETLEDTSSQYSRSPSPSQIFVPAAEQNSPVREFSHHVETILARRRRQTEGIARERSSEMVTALTTAEIIEQFPLKPNSLTTAQKEMLLETEWAQRAFMQSYALAIIDNPSTFSNVKKLIIARLPSRHLTNLRRDDFWDSLSNLQTLSLSIIPDWREVSKLPTSYVDDTGLIPTKATIGVFHLLQDQISPRESIQDISFQWICGGEDATGLFARNKLILPAPLVEKAANMIARNDTPPMVLDLPHVRSLTLKNCWVSPHILNSFTQRLRSQLLQTITLDSISLTAPVSLGTHAQPMTAAAAQVHAAQAQALNAAQHALAVPMNQPANPGAITNVAPPAAAPAQTQTTGIEPAPPSWLDEPSPGSWADIIDRITPGKTLAAYRFEAELGPEPPEPRPTNLVKIYFISCGYVRLPLDFNQLMLEGPASNSENTTITKRRSDLENHMMKTSDYCLGTIINYISQEEFTTLEMAWNIEPGWSLDMNKALASLFIEDGIPNPGTGRFRGIIAAPQR